MGAFKTFRETDEMRQQSQPTTDLDTLLAQREELKRRDPDAILLFRVEDELGDNYRAYKEDANTLRVLLGWSIPGATFHGLPDRFCIEPAALESVLARIVAAGKRAAVCERVVDPLKPPKGRKVERIVTPGKIDEPAATASSTPGQAASRSDADIIDDARGLAAILRRGEPSNAPALDADLVEELIARLEAKDSLPDFQSAAAYFLMLSVRLGASEIPKTFKEWAQSILKGEPRSGIEIVEAAIAKSKGPAA